LIPDVVDGFGEILFGIDQRTVEVKYENRPHGLIIALWPAWDPPASCEGSLG